MAQSNTIIYFHKIFINAGAPDLEHLLPFFDKFPFIFCRVNSALNDKQSTLHRKSVDFTWTPPGTGKVVGVEVTTGVSESKIVSIYVKGNSTNALWGIGFVRSNGTMHVNGYQHSGISVSSVTGNIVIWYKD